MQDRANSSALFFFSCRPSDQKFRNDSATLFRLIATHPRFEPLDERWPASTRPFSKTVFTMQPAEENAHPGPKPSIDTHSTIFIISWILMVALLGAWMTSARIDNREGAAARTSKLSASRLHSQRPQNSPKVTLATSSAADRAVAKALQELCNEVRKTGRPATTRLHFETSKPAIMTAG
jgi:hypothetical protein